MKTSISLRGILRGAALSATVALAPAALASPLTLTWSADRTWDGNYHYIFKLTLDNSDNSWVPGQGFGWLIFADGGAGASPLSDFSADSYGFPAGPWDQITKTAGLHNGPTLSFGRRAWVPNGLGDSVTWSGTSAVLIQPGQLYWTALVTAGGAKQVEHQAAIKVASCGPGDVNYDGFIDGLDLQDFLASFETGALRADVNRDGFVDGTDYEIFMLAFDRGCG